MKATSIFGGVQVFNIIIQIIRSKAVAVLLGPAGMGIMALFTSTIGLVSRCTSFGLGTSAVKNVASANATGDVNEIAKIVQIFRRLVWLTGGMGFLVTIVLAPWLSELAFNNKSYTLAFALLSITLLFTQITAGQSAILQGMRKIQFMAKAGMLGSLAGLIISLPLYYFFAQEGIVFAIIATSIVTLIVSWYFARKVNIPKITVSKSDFNIHSKEMLRMGFLISLGGLMTVGASYVLRIYISQLGGINEVGLFSAGFTIINVYVGMVFTAMSTDYYPRLSAVAFEKQESIKTINQQAEIAILILAPIIMVFLVFIQWIVIILYSKEFLGAIPMIHWAILGIFFKAISLSIGYILLARSDSKLFFWNELSANLYILVFNIIGYKFGGLSGLGISFLVSYAAYALQIYVVTKIKYGFQLNKNLILLFSIQIFLAILCYCIVYFLKVEFAYLLGSCIIVMSSLYSWRELNKRIGIKEIIQSRLTK